MSTPFPRHEHDHRRRRRWLLTAYVGGLGVVLLIADHWAHVFGVLPYVLLLACPLMHFLHGGHGSHSHSSPPKSGGPRARV